MLKQSRSRRLVILVGVLVFAVIGYLVIHNSKAATNADINNDGGVGIADLTILAANYGQNGKTFSQGDITGDGTVNIYDFSILAANWGNGTPTGVNKARPFAANSPWNTPTPVGTQWFDTPTMHVNTDYSHTGHWSLTVGSIGIFWSSPSDPIWTFNMPDYVAPTWGRNRPATSFTLRAPANIVVGTDSDHALVVADPVSGNYVEVWEASIDASTHTVTSNGPGWATGNAITGLGVGGLVADGGNNAGIRASNFSTIGGLLTSGDWKSGVIDHALVVALNPQILKRGAPTPYLAPATSGDAGGANTGLIIMGSKLGIPSDQVMPTVLNAEIPAGSGKRPGKMLWEALQKYGMYVGDVTGGTTQFYADFIDVPGAAPNFESGYWSPLFAFWDNNYGTGKSAMEIILPYLRVADYQP